LQVMRGVDLHGNEHFATDVLNVLMIGCGDVALRVASLLRGRVRLVGLVRRAHDASRLRDHGIVPIVGDLDDFRTLARLSARAHAVLHFAPPPGEGRDDPRTRKLLAALAKSGSLPQRFVYISTSGVYGDCEGARIAETRRRRAQTPLAKRRVAAENRVRSWAARHRVTASILRVPGIYASTRLPVDRVRQRTPVLAADEDVYTNHIHADDLARACIAALFRAAPQRVYHASDDSRSTMGEHFDAVADAFGLPRAPRLGRDAMRAAVSEMQWSFMAESRRLDNTRLTRELRLRLAYPTPAAAWAAAR
jgi:nucleoside-diphosphate-sugar epimerase